MKISLSAKVILGLVLGLPANKERGWGGYSGLRRRCARLGHIAGVMLPLIGGFRGRVCPET